MSLVALHITTTGLDDTDGITSITALELSDDFTVLDRVEAYMPDARADQVAHITGYPLDYLERAKELDDSPLGPWLDAINPRYVIVHNAPFVLGHLARSGEQIRFPVLDTMVVGRKYCGTGSLLDLVRRHGVVLGDMSAMIAQVAKAVVPNIAGNDPARVMAAQAEWHAEFLASCGHPDQAWPYSI